MELGELPRPPRTPFAAYLEGWALYAETLGFEGLYRTHQLLRPPAQQAPRARSTVVDTGIHSLGWSRQEAIDYMVAHTG